MDYDLKITGGTIVDGSGKPGFKGDVGIKGGKVVALGSAPGTAAQTIDAAGRVVAPGFVDVHTHYDAQILWDRGATISPWHGVTTAVMGNCGFGVAPTRPSDRLRIMQTLENVEGMSLDALKAGLGENWGFETFPQYLDALERNGSAINLAVLVGHTPVRLHAMGEASTERAANPEEIETMRLSVSEAVKAGALGFATSKAITHNGYAGRPVPSRQATYDEIDTLATAARDAGAPLMQITFGKEFFIEEMSKLSRERGIRVTWTALLAGLAGPGSHRKYLDRTEAEKKTGADVIPQVSCRPLFFEFNWASPFPFESMKLFNTLAAECAKDPGARVRAYRDPAWRRTMEEQLLPFLRTWAERTTITWSPKDRSLEEQPLAAAAAKAGKAPLDFAIDLALDCDLEARFRIALINHDEGEVEELLKDGNTVIALSDAGAHASQLCDACYATYFLAKWVREKKVFTLEQGVHMLTQRPADLFGIKDRGLLAVGRPADVVVFDPATVAPSALRRVFDLPGGADRLVADATGVAAVVVNGAVIRRDDADALPAGAALPGRVLRHGHAA
ncbi:MAG: amidohydrolase family protein [Rhodospirillales bacterium]|nr:amidohydrolase family protein [Rhodospirillales bacterium]